MQPGWGNSQNTALAARQSDASGQPGDPKAHLAALLPALVGEAAPAGSDDLAALLDAAMPSSGEPHAPPGTATALPHTGAGAPHDLQPRLQANPLAAAHPDDSVPAVRLLTDTLLDAARRGASDLHIEPGEFGWRIRLRIDGVLHETARPPAHLRDAFVTRIKVLARLDIAERRVPQDGRLRLALAPGKTEEYRVNTLPTLFGEKLVLRRLDALPADLSLGSLGLDSAQQATLEAALGAPHGMLLVTGPTGSGKTLSLYCFMQRLNREALNLCSVEDPAEIQLAGINQVSVHAKAGLTFATALRAFLRQDPDVIMVGEIRDAETADVAIKAAQTGHLVLSTLHTNDAPAAITRLGDIGVAPHNLAAALRVVCAQRLVRKLCAACRMPAAPSVATLRAAGYAECAIGDWQPYRHRPGGCAACHGVGYRGRIGIHQVMPVSPAMRELMVAAGSTRAIAQQAARDGVRTLREAALARVREGVTSLGEGLAATESDA